MAAAACHAGRARQSYERVLPLHRCCLTKPRRPRWRGPWSLHTALSTERESVQDIRQTG